MTWWLLLYSFSILARYEQRRWVKLLDRDSSKGVAVLLQYALEEALSAVPQLVLEALDKEPYLLSKPFANRVPLVAPAAARPFTLHQAAASGASTIAGVRGHERILPYQAVPGSRMNGVAEPDEIRTPRADFGDPELAEVRWVSLAEAEALMADMTELVNRHLRRTLRSWQRRRASGRPGTVIAAVSTRASSDARGTGVPRRPLRQESRRRGHVPAELQGLSADFAPRALMHEHTVGRLSAVLANRDCHAFWRRLALLITAPARLRRFLAQCRL